MSHGPRQTTGCLISKDSAWTVCTLRVHPWLGERLRVLRRHGPDRLFVERENGETRLIPVSWTDLTPAVGGPDCRFELQALVVLARVVEDRVQHLPGTKLDADDLICSTLGAQDNAEHGGPGSAGVVVGQAGAPDDVGG